MNDNYEELVFDESEAIRFILDFIPKTDQNGMDDDTVQFVLDSIYDYYESQGLVEDDEATEAEIDEQDMFDYVKNDLVANEIILTDQQIHLILEGEFEYGKSIGIYDDED
ncbi:MAG: hypothetical protein IJS05_04325 [Paludibacteraceae bacterium]|nr:hypothetical protein [Paludibacteraceae bacterium]